ncbi:disease resistance protein RUN1-like [Eucalyptus grandis]|uniref:disease resistance protein RUN1-like n=1 Tax=Eucalyptus grandis TaxID=71139 RepID=UPI00192EDD64|nr:disease resistance protein RUN1-like [Eucalyptus grandis]
MGNNFSRLGNYFSKQRPKRPRDTGASSPTPSKRPRPDVLEESPLLPPPSDSSEKVNGPSASGANFLLPSSDSSEKINVPSESGANSRPSASSTSVIGNNYHVFLSFRGPDTRKSFVDHLYHRLKDVGLKFHPNFVFRDDESLPFGENIAANLLGAIEHSKVSIPVISENYAASEWCLRELIHIMECKESREQIVLPVLYKVKPKDVRHLGGSFGEAFRIHEHRFDEEVKQQGPTALKKALDLRVFESEEFADGCEGKLVNKLVEIIVREQQADFHPHLPVNLVGIEDRVAEVMKLVDIACPDTRIIGIWGMGGIGKTTLATIIYNKLFNKFKCRSFLQDIRETTRSKGMEYVQSLMISNLTKNPESRVHDSKTGITMIRSSCEKKVLILLDDVDRRDHLEYLIGHCNFESGSRIIITCRDKILLKSEYKIYELKEMNHKESFLLFSRYAFEEEQLPTNLATLSRDIVATTGGLPLALVVIGSLLNGVKDQMAWRETLKKLRNTPDKTVKEKLRISYDTLEYKQQQMFLDIACFFNGTDKRIATYLWEDLKFYPIIELQVLIHCSLIKIDGNNLLRMHDQLRDLGRAIARPEDVKPWHWSRPWDVETTKILGRKEENENIEALRLDERGSKEFIKQESFKKMPNLKFLHVKDVDFDGDFEGSLVELRWLKWQGCRSDSFEATNFHLEKLVVLELSGDHYCRGISENWRGWSSIKMERLKVLNLLHCRLRSIPNLSAFKNLEMLILNYCDELEEIDSSIRDVKCLVSLKLSYCQSLKKFPEQLGELEKLEELVVNHTSIKEIPPCIGSLKKLKRLIVDWPLIGGLPLVRIPSSIGKLRELLELYLSFTIIKELPESIGELNKLKILKIFNCHIKRLPSSIGKLQSLQELLASDCQLMGGEIHLDKGGLSSLKTLDLQLSKFSGLPENLDQLSSLEHLDLGGCGELESLPKPHFSLSYLRVTCRSNELPSLSHLKHLQELSLDSCKSLQSIPSLSHLERLATPNFMVATLFKASQSSLTWSIYRSSSFGFASLFKASHLSLT